MKLHRAASANEVVCCCGRMPLPLALFCVLRRALIGSSRGARETPVGRSAPTPATTTPHFALLVDSCCYLNMMAEELLGGLCEDSGSQ